MSEFVRLPSGAVFNLAHVHEVYVLGERVCVRYADGKIVRYAEEADDAMLRRWLAEQELLIPHGSVAPTPRENP